MAREPFYKTLWSANRVLPCVILALVLINFAAYLIVSNTLEPKTEALERTLIQKQERLRTLKQSGEKITPRAGYRQGREDLLRFREAIPPKEDFTTFIGELFDLAAATRLAINRVKYDPAELDQLKLQRYALSFDVTGDYGQIKKFIHLLEQSPRIVILEEISLIGGESEESKIKQVSLRIRLSTYFRTVSL